MHPNSVCRVHPIFAECELPLLGPAGALPTVGGRNTFLLLGCVASRAVGGDTQGLITNATKNRQPRKLAMLELTPLSGALGAEVHALDLSRPLGSDLATELKKAFYDHVVLLFRGQGLDAASKSHLPKTLAKSSHIPYVRGGASKGIRAFSFSKINQVSQVRETTIGTPTSFMPNGHR